MKLKSINRVFMQVIVATVSNRLLILRCVSFFDSLATKPYSMPRTSYYALPGLTWATSGVRAIDFWEDLRIHVACVAPAPLSTGACALPRKNMMAMVGIPLIRTILHNRSKYSQINVIVKESFLPVRNVSVGLKYRMLWWHSSLLE